MLALSIFPASHPASIVDEYELNFCVRDGNRWTLAEPGAGIGFAGARVVEQTTKKPLPKGFQKAESMLAHGFVDSIVPRAKQKEAISQLLAMHEGGLSHGDGV